MKYSIILPVYNEESTIQALFQKVKELLVRLDGESEVIFINDGSRDNSYDLLLSVSKQDSRFKVINLARNFGHQLAITAGMDLSTGDAVIVMDADLQDPPEVVLDMIQKWKEGYDVVYAVREQRKGESYFKLATASIFYRVLNKMSEVSIPLDVGDFRLVDRAVIEAFGHLRESNRFVRGMFSWLGFKQTGIFFKRNERFAGETKYPLIKMMKFATDGIISFSQIPLNWILNFGFAVSAFSFVMAFYFIGLKLWGHTVEGWTSLIVVVTFIGGIQLIMLGVIGQYVGRIYTEAKRRPLYVVKSVHGFKALKKPERAILPLLDN
jgi:glycosyltransferase involved in cell wall biosynthesis